MNKIVNNPSFTDEGTATEQLEEKIELQEEQSTEENKEENTEEQENKEGSEEETQKTEEPQKVKIGDKEFTAEELSGIVEKGTKVKEWETKMPGFNLDTLMPDYTKKSQRLAAMERQSFKAEPQDLSDVDADEVQKFEKIAKHFGYVRQTDLAQSTVESQKEAFLSQHPEYNPGNTINDAKWSQLMEQFSVYNWQAFPHKVGDLLEKAHVEVSKSWNETKVNERTKETIVTKKAVADATAISGGNAQKQSNQSSNTALADKYRVLGWTEEDIKEILT